MSIVARRFFSGTRVKLDTLALLEGTNGKPTPASLSTIAAAIEIGKPITALILGSNADSIAAEVAKTKGVDNVLISKDSKYDHLLAEEVTPLIKQIIQGDGSNYTHFLTPNSSVGKSVLPRLGALLDVQPISEVIKVIDVDTFMRPIYAGNALATVKSKDSIILASIRASAFAPIEETTGQAVTIEEVSQSSESGSRTEFVSEELISSERPELGSATRVVAGGRGLKNKETFEKLIEPLASKLNAAIGASRAAVDSGFCDNSLQVGQTGKIVAPDLYIAVGISGAIQHLAGMKDAKTIVAINKDSEAAIFNVADVGLVGDLNEIVPELIEKL
ncbi:ETF1 [[Candida] subhashii]|uniref:Probable electron transfer flavoprotein subunit alpha n=1 Tax=[Candida] subhashii TaxID=561895 RepID=A0A8J5QJG6_9ASCO|nr:ETF1 [[Candida] subhashii]KAG7662201.1 ETF1 [[Candida] subhashii]